MKKFILLTILIPLFSLGQANKYVRQGLRTTDFKEQISLFSQAIDLDDKHLDAYFYRGLAQFNLGEYNSSILDFTKVIFYKPDADSYYNRANAKFNLEDFEGAAFDYEKATELDPNLIDAFSNLGTAKLYLEEYKDAIKALDKAIRLFPTNDIALLHRAKAHMALKNYKLAFSDYRYHLYLNTSSNSYYERGLALLEVKYFKEARKDFAKALKKDRNNIPVYFYLATTHLLLGDYQGAIATYTLLTKRDDLDFDAHLGLALAYLKTSDLKSAKTHFDKVKNILSIREPNNMDSFENTYWHQNQKLYFNQPFEELTKL